MIVMDDKIDGGHPIVGFWPIVAVAGACNILALFASDWHLACIFELIVFNYGKGNLFFSIFVLFCFVFGLFG